MSSSCILMIQLLYHKGNIYLRISASLCEETRYLRFTGVFLFKKKKSRQVSFITQYSYSSLRRHISLLINKHYSTLVSVPETQYLNTLYTTVGFYHL